MKKGLGPFNLDGHLELVSKPMFPPESMETSDTRLKIIAEIIQEVLEIRNPINSFAVTWDYARVKIAEELWRRYFTNPNKGQKTPRKPIIPARMGLTMGRQIKRP